MDTPLDHLFAQTVEARGHRTVEHDVSRTQQEPSD
jgi:hypothetical protein